MFPLSWSVGSCWLRSLRRLGICVVAWVRCGRLCRPTCCVLRWFRRWIVPIVVRLFRWSIWSFCFPFRWAVRPRALSASRLEPGQPRWLVWVVLPIAPHAFRRCIYSASRSPSLCGPSGHTGCGPATGVRATGHPPGRLLWVIAHHGSTVHEAHLGVCLSPGELHLLSPVFDLRACPSTLFGQGVPSSVRWLRLRYCSCGTTLYHQVSSA